MITVQMRFTLGSSESAEVSGDSFDIDGGFDLRRCQSDFRQSMWFTRGWTLQDLLAPRSVVVFSREGQKIGDKGLLEQQIHEITVIPLNSVECIQMKIRH